MAFGPFSSEASTRNFALDDRDVQSVGAGGRGIQTAPVIIEGGGKKSKTNVNVTQTDLGAVQSALDAIDSSNARSNEFGFNVLGFADRLGQRAQDSVLTATNELGKAFSTNASLAARTSNTPSENVIGDLTKFGVIAVGIWGAVLIARGFFK